jgi:hypothetical protein
MTPPNDQSQSRFARFLVPIIAAVLIDGISEALKGLGTFIVKEISDDVMLSRVDWDGAGVWLMGTVAMIVLLYFVLRGFSRYESHNLGARTAVLVVTLILIGSTNLWEVVLERPTMRKMYDEVVPGKSSLQDVGRKFLANWNQSVSFHSDDQFGLCINDCSFALIYTVPKVFGEGRMKLDFDANKTVLRKRWYD